MQERTDRGVRNIGWYLSRARGVLSASFSHEIQQLRHEVKRSQLGAGAKLHRYARRQAHLISGAERN